MDKSSLCANCKLRVGDYCFCGDEPERLTDNPIIKCDYFIDDSISTYYEFIDGYEHCNKLKRIELHKKIKELKRPQGEWVAREDIDYLDENKVVHKHFQCNNCGLVHDFIDGHTSQYNFCPNCGAEMEIKP